ncbi:hypothetical protein OE88DRAFT_1561614 [Heliocybe sulcata]|uniref:Enhancer of polycomb-like N-terminal domain-containing protein n=1 Tax=Heliocybe sulcata TaxID=5364 RepID=A0A5C3N2Q3_9AGAM|nr:hypothetical protein OE88DRAFT_1561614 [Heliocybe sulcata]
MARGNEDRAILRSRNFPRHHTMLKILRSVEVSATSREHAEDISAVTTAGVDVRDVNEHHLQAALGVSLHAIQGHAALSGTKEPITCIPVPDFKDVSRLYPALAQEERRWNDSFNYLQSSDTVEQSIEDGLVDGFTYFMDEKDAQWLTHTNNCNMESKVPDEDVPQIKQECDGWLCGPIDAVQSGGRIAPRASLSCTGKSQNAMSGIRISEDHFELVMGIFEKVTADVLKASQVVFDAHVLGISSCQESGGDHRDSVQADEGAVAGIPPFSTYEETFATKLTPVLFATYRVPKWVPESPVLTAMARTIFPHWIKRRTMPRGLEVLPGLHVCALSSRFLFDSILSS